MSVDKHIEKFQENNHQSEHIAIIGAGISGLVAAYEFARLGHTVTIFEGSHRIGGRILTSHYGDQHGELGAMRIPSGHDYPLHYASLLHLPLGRFVNEEKNAFYRILGRTEHIKDGRKLAQLFDLNQAELKLVEEKGVGALIQTHTRSLMGKLSDTDIAHLYSGNFEGSSQSIRKLDGW